MPDVPQVSRSAWPYWLLITASTIGIAIGIRSGVLGRAEYIEQVINSTMPPGVALSLYLGAQLWIYAIGLSVLSSLVLFAGSRKHNAWVMLIIQLLFFTLFLATIIVGLNAPVVTGLTVS